VLVGEGVIRLSAVSFGFECIFNAFGISSWKRRPFYSLETGSKRFSNLLKLVHSEEKTGKWRKCCISKLALKGTLFTR
jgi:hypothetical protein